MGREIPEVLLTRQQVANLYKIEKRWLELAAHKGNGPPIVKISRRMVRYRVSDIERWIDSKTISELDPGGESCSRNS